jgi:GT2 family glycosyltransferase
MAAGGGDEQNGHVLALVLAARMLKFSRYIGAAAPAGRDTTGADIPSMSAGELEGSSEAFAGAPVASVSVVIPTRRPPERLGATIAQLAGDPAVREVIVIDDRPGAPARADWSNVGSSVMLRTGGVGPSVARQRGVEAASARIVLLLDDDVVPGAALASGHARRHDTPGLLVVGHMPVTAPANRDREPIPHMLYRLEYAARVEAYEREPGDVLMHLWAGNLSMAREDALRIGIANTTFGGHRHEDRDLGLRCLAAGMTAVFDRRLVSEHDYRRSERAFLADARAQGAERTLLHAAHPQLLGPQPSDAYSAGLPAPLAGLVRACRLPVLERPVAFVLAGALALAHLADRRAAAVATLKLARRIQQQAGAAAVERELGRS